MPFAFQIGSSASQDRLEKLIELRLRHGADKDAIDARIWDLFGETWAIMFTDLTGFSRRTAEFGIIHFLQTIFEAQRLLVPVIDAHDGILLKQDGDSMMILFRRPEKAIECARQMLDVLAAYNPGKPETERILLCLGVGYGKMLRIGDSDVFGAEVNAAAKLGEDTAKTGEILVTEAVVEACTETRALRFEPIPDIPSGANAAFRIVN
ncbi:MAG TPA: adenylate/guanylate cyclase domain-containing protein [Pseudomonadales bacterium]